MIVSFKSYQYFTQRNPIQMLLSMMAVKALINCGHRYIILHKKNQVMTVNLRLDLRHLKTATKEVVLRNGLVANRNQKYC